MSRLLKKDECERAIRPLCHQWARECGLSKEQLADPSFSDFKDWLSAKGYSRYLEFRSVMGADEDAERWFDQEFKQMWRY